MELNLKKLRIVNVTLSVCVALVMSGIVMDFQFMGERRDLSDPGEAVKKSAKAAALSSGGDFTENKVILSSGFMGSGGKLLYIRDRPKKRAPVVPAMSGRTIKAPRGNITLKGTIVSDVGSSLAIFEDKRTKRQELVSIGGDVFGTGKITVIDEDRVLLSVSGGLTHEYSMDFEAGGITSGIGGNSARRGRPGTGNGLIAKAKWAKELKMMRDMQQETVAFGHYDDSTSGVSPQDFVDVSDLAGEDVDDDFSIGEAYEVKSDLLGGASLPGASEVLVMPLREEGSGEARMLGSLSEVKPSRPLDWWDVYDALGNYSANALTYISYKPSESGGTVNGFLVNELEDGLFHVVFDLAAGDVITSVNKVPLDSPDAWLKVSDGLWNSTKIEITFLRDAALIKQDFEVR